jgi:hypothetical protein
MYSENTELIDLVGKMLVAARLQEGLRQAICERCDGGTMTAFRSNLGVIKDNDLIRFSSVKRAVGTWCGLIAHKSDTPRWAHTTSCAAYSPLTGSRRHTRR